VDAAQNMALDHVLLERCAAGTSPPTLRFMGFDPPAVLVGAFQRVQDEIRLEWCREHGIEVNRRLTGGGAIFFDTSQLGWEVVGRREDLGGAPSEELFERLCRPVVEALRRLGIAAAYRPRNDIEVDGRKISGTGGTSLGDALLFQGTLLTDFDAETMVRALRIPVEKLRRREMDTLMERVTWIGRELGRTPPRHDLVRLIARCFGRSLGVEMEPGELSGEERGDLLRELDRFESDEWVVHRGRRPSTHVRALRPTPGGMLRPLVSCDPERSRIHQVVLDGDFFSFPARGVLDLEAALKGAHVRDLGRIVEELFSSGRIRVPGMQSGHVIAALAEALDRRRVQALGLTNAQANSAFGVCCELERIDGLEPTHLLLPYCAKPLDCAHRHEDACDRCGGCDVGECYEMGEARGLEVRSITSFEHLMDTLAELARAGVPAWMGSCCEPFYVKHREEIESFDLPGVLFDVASNETCYDLGKGSLAYAGRFEGLSEMDVTLLEVLLEVCGAGKGHGRVIEARK
jgi:lipoate-protein ligase A